MNCRVSSFPKVCSSSTKVFSFCQLPLAALMPNLACPPVRQVPSRPSGPLLRFCVAADGESPLTNSNDGSLLSRFSASVIRCSWLGAKW
jgi:hypothetical protein